MQFNGRCIARCSRVRNLCCTFDISPNIMRQIPAAGAGFIRHHFFLWVQVSCCVIWLKLMSIAGMQNGSLLDIAYPYLERHTPARNR
uniref:Uncharacterized protein n=1 Tax=Megaselia scalaris TaxID=36166 RepID=T1GAZ2_MEGSC